MNAPIPAAVRYSLKTKNLNECTDEEIYAFNKETRNPDEILRDHIIVVVEEMRRHADEGPTQRGGLTYFADRLEGLK